jgi:ribonuclease HI
VFDGGSKGNPGPAFGSYRISPWGSQSETIARLQFGRGTNNEAEYLSLIASLRALRAFLHGKDQALSQSGVVIRGDSQLVLRQIGGKWKAKDPRMKAFRDEAKSLLLGFGKVSLIEQPRERTVETLGH